MVCPVPFKRMSLHPYGRLTLNRLEKFESTLGFPLPPDYHDFLLQNNGGKFQGSTVIVSGLNERVALDSFLGLDLEPRLNLEFVSEEYRKDIPKGCLIIGTDPGGGLVLLSTNAKWSGIYYWDHSFWFEKSTAQNNIYPLARSLTDLLKAVS